MRQEFVNKTISFFGDSITEHGQYIYNLRAYFHTAKEKCFVLNRGIGGNRAIHAKEELQRDVIADNPDFVVIAFGVNDLGIWLYDCKSEVNDDIIRERTERNRLFFDGIKYSVENLLNKGIVPIIATPFAVNSEIEERSDVDTLADNGEKERLKPSFYKKATFQNINKALAGYSEELKKIAGSYNIEVFDTFTKTFEIIREKTGLFSEDGIHYSDKGFVEIAKIILNFLGVTDIPEQFKRFIGNDEIFALERKERGVKAALSLKYKFPEIKKDDAEFYAQMKRFATESAKDEYFVNCARTFLDNFDAYKENRESIKTLTYNF